jgi:competence protein ComEC
MTGIKEVNERNLAGNNRSLVLRLQEGKRSFLFPGDIEKEAEAILAGAPIELTSEVMLAAHHGSITSSSSRILDQTQPQYIIVSASRHKKGTYPHPHLEHDWQGRGIRVMTTGKQGSIFCSTDGRSLHWQVMTAPLKSERHRYRMAPVQLDSLFNASKKDG